MGVEGGDIGGGVVDDAEGGVEGVGRRWCRQEGGEQAVQEVEIAEGAGVEEIGEGVDLAAGDAPLEGKVAPGEVPVVGLARLAAVATALARPMVLVAEAPMFPPGARNWERAQAVATVVTSLTTTGRRRRLDCRRRGR